MSDHFVPGLQLSERFYWGAVHPILNAEFPALPHSAALVGPGSEVLGFDTSMSTDHHWGPRLLLFLDESDHGQYAEAMNAALAEALPNEFLGYPTNFTEPDPDDAGTQLLAAIDAGPVNHRVEIYTLRSYLREYLDYDIDTSLEAADWLTMPEQRLRSITAGAVYHDEVGLAEVRARFTYYPRDVWIYLLACGWARIGQEEHLMGRAGLVGDEIGSALIGARLVRDIMRLCFLMERTYAPYPKWFGTAFQQLASSSALTPHIQSALTADRWQARQQHLVSAYETLARWHNALGLTKPMPETTRDFFGRPFEVIALHGFSHALLAEIDDPAVAAIAQRSPIGSIDQFSDSTDLRSDVSWRPIVRQLYTG